MVASIPTSRPPSARSESSDLGRNLEGALDDNHVERTEGFCARIERPIYDRHVLPA